MAKSYPIDPSVEWWINGIEGCEEDEVVRSYNHYNLRVAEFRQDNEKTTSLAPQTPANIEAVLSLLRRAQDLQEQYREWYTALPGKPDALAWVEWSDLGLRSKQTHLPSWAGRHLQGTLDGIRIQRGTQLPNPDLDDNTTLCSLAESE
jgi:hypothetical protein